MKNILYIGKYNGIIGGIERYMQKSAELLRLNGLKVYYLYTENGGREQEKFADAFDSVAEFSTENNLIASADIIVIHNIINPEISSINKSINSSYSSLCINSFSSVKSTYKSLSGIQLIMLFIFNKDISSASLPRIFDNSFSLQIL